MNASDLRESSIGYSNANFFTTADELLDEAYKTISKFKSLFPEYNSTPEEFFDSGKMMNNAYFKKMNDSKVLFTSVKVEQEIY
jgi:hypothetical protein